MLSFNKVKIVLAGKKTHKKRCEDEELNLSQIMITFMECIGQSVSTTEKHSRQECLVTVAY